MEIHLLMSATQPPLEICGNTSIGGHIIRAGMWDLLSFVGDMSISFSCICRAGSAVVLPR